jgi:hypothetical protein
MPQAPTINVKNANPAITAVITIRILMIDKLVLIIIR